MTLTIECKRQPLDEGSSDQNQQRTYKSVYHIKQTDTGSRASAYDLITLAQTGAGGDDLPVYGEQYVDAGDTDLDSYAQTFAWKLRAGADHQKLLVVDVGFAPAAGFNPGRLSVTDPLLWATEPYMDRVEESVVIDKAYNVEALPSIGRAALTLGKVVNACGVEFTEAAMRTIQHGIYYFEKQYDSLDDISTLNDTYQGTTNNATFHGAPTRTLKYLTTTSGKIQKINGYSFYVGLTALEFKRSGWDRELLNNGWSHFTLDDGGALVEDPFGGGLLLKNKVFDDAQTFIDDPDASRDTPCSEPLNLDLDGLLVPPGDEPVYVTYRYLEEVDYSGIGL